MLQIEDAIISLDIIEKKFVCDLSHCKGICCVEGDSGAPLEEDEVEKLKEIYSIVEPYMTEEGKKAVQEQGVSVIDQDGDIVTPLVNNSECAFVCYDGDIVKCSIEKAFLDQKIDFQKPVSCHLYPIRIKKYADFSAVNYNKWEICQGALMKGEKLGLPLYKYLRIPLVRKFGQDWYDQLLYFAENYNKENNG